jgi:hypothetical protein
MSAEFGPVPLLLGVAGHRHLPPRLDGLRETARTVLADFREKYPFTRIVLLCALAEGSDRLVAQEALDLGLSLVVPLPMAVDEYVKTFTTPESVAEFRALSARADAAFVVPHGSSGAYIAAHCVELIALWDGKDSSTDATAKVVSFQLDGIPAPYAREERAFDPSLCGPVLHVVIPREGSNNSGLALTVTRRYPRSVVDPAAAFEHVKCDIERFNRDVIHGPIAKHAGKLTVREQAEALATIYQARTTQSLLAITTAVFFAVIAFNLYTAYPAQLWLFILYVGFTAAAFVPYLISKHGEWQLRHQDYRALEQALRTHEYWRMAGIKRSVATQFAASERTKIDWVVVAIRAITEPPESESLPAPPASASELRVVYEEWILGQYRYFTEFAGRRDRVRQEVASRAVTVAVALSIALAVGTALGSSFGLFRETIGLQLSAAAIFAVAAALIHNFADKRGWADHRRHYELMATLFGYAAERVSPLLDGTRADPATVNSVHAILITLGDEAMRESAAWLNLHRSRPVNVPRV